MNEVFRDGGREVSGLKIVTSRSALSKMCVISVHAHTVISEDRVLLIIDQGCLLTKAESWAGHHLACWPLPGYWQPAALHDLLHAPQTYKLLTSLQSWTAWRLGM